MNERRRQRKSEKKRKRRELRKRDLRALKISRASAAPPKMSEVLIDLAQPLIATAKHFEQIEFAIGLAAAAWNAILKAMAEDSSQAMHDLVDEWIDRGIPEDTATDLLSMFSERALAHGGDPRLVISHQVTQTGGPLDYHVQAAWSFEPRLLRRA